MAHVNFHSLATEPRQCHSRTFPAPALPGGEFTLKLMDPDALTDYYGAEIAAELMRRYVEGNTALGMPAAPFMVGKEAKLLSPLLCDDVGRICAMQPADWEDRYEPEEVLMMAFKARPLWLQVRRWARELYAGAGEALPNASGAEPEGASSAPPLTAEPSTRELSATSA